MIDLQHAAPRPSKKDYRIGVIGAGFVVREVQLVAYRNAGYNVVAITSQPPDQAREVARIFGIPKVYDSTEELLADTSIEVVDVAVPPECQPAVIRAAARRADHVRGILAQKPLAMNFDEAVEIVRLCQEAGVTLAVNQNMRYDQSIRALRTLLDRGYVGEPVVATIEMRSPRRYKPWAKRADRVTLLVMSIHHLDCFRFLFGEPDYVYASARTDPRATFAHRDGIVMYILEYASGLRAAAWDDVWAGPALEGAAADTFVKWRVEGTEGMARGAIGWPFWPNAVPSTIDYTSVREPGCWISPRWKETWFPDAFEGTMGELLDSLASGREPAISGRDNLGTMALVEACYRSLEEHRPVALAEIRAGACARLAEQ